LAVAQKVEREIEASSDWDTIDAHISVFHSAVVLDEFVSQEVTARLNTLRQLREKKEVQVDDHLQDMIRSNNFKGMADFLSPLAKSKGRWMPVLPDDSTPYSWVNVLDLPKERFLIRRNTVYSVYLQLDLEVVEVVEPLCKLILIIY